MKHLNDYILEKQEEQLNEGSLFGDIIRTFLGWIGSSVAWMANTFKEMGKEGWDTFKNMNERVWIDVVTKTNKELGTNYKIPRNASEYSNLIAEMTKEGTLEEKVKRFTVLRKHLLEADTKLSKHDIDKLYAENVYFLCVAELNSDKASDTDKAYAEKIIKELKRNFGSHIKNIEHKLEEDKKKSKKSTEDKKKK